MAIVHYWFVTWRGGEKVVDQLLRLYPDADIFTHVFDEKKFGKRFENNEVKCSFINRLPLSKKYYQKYLPLMPIALEQLDLRGYDLVISSESGPAKGVITDPDTLHICYCHSPMRYVWDMCHDYTRSVGWFTRQFIRPLFHYLRIYDSISATRVDTFVANSEYVKKRIRKSYRRDSEVIYPPVDMSQFGLSEKEDFYLVLGELVPYKKAEIVVQAFDGRSEKLRVIGGGEMNGINCSEISRNISIMGRQPWSVCVDNLKKAKALIFPGVEDFGMVPVEAMASGTPILAYRKGGASETVCENVTGLFFEEQTPEAVWECVETFETQKERFSKEKIRAYAERFSDDLFRKKIHGLVTRELSSQTDSTENDQALRLVE